MNNSLIYFNTASNGLIEPEANALLQDFHQAMEENPSSYFMSWMTDRKEGLRKMISSMINAKMNEIALIPNTSFGITSFCFSLPKNHRVGMLKDDYPSLFEPFHLQGFPIEFLDDVKEYNLDYDRIEDMIRDRSFDVLALSHVQYLNGYRADLKRLGKLCRENKVLLVVDATQSWGAELIDVQEMGIDVLIASNYKWMNAGLGGGILYIREEVLDQYLPQIGGYGSYVLKGNDFRHEASIKSYEPGHLSVSSLLILEHVLQSRNRQRVEEIALHNHRLAANFRKGLRQRKVRFFGQESDEIYHSAIVCIEANESDYQLIKGAGIECSYRRNSIRFSFHYYNNQDQINQFFERFDKLDFGGNR